MRRLMFAVLFALPACQTDETISGYADRAVIYRLEQVNGRSFAARATIAFPEPGTVSGQAPCNRYSASQTVPYPWISIGPIATARVACPDLAQESLFFEALKAASLAEVQGGTLILSNDAGLQMVFRAQD